MSKKKHKKEKKGSSSPTLKVFNSSSICESLLSIGSWNLTTNDKKLSLSEGCKEILDFTDEKNIIKDIKEYITPDDFIKLESAFQKIIKDKTDQIAECKVTYEKYGARISKTLKIKAIYVKQKDNNTIFGTLQDITDFRRNEDDLIKAKEKAEQSDRLKTAFLANLSHEIRTPMNAIIGFTELINIGGLSTEKKQEYSNIILHKGKELLTMVDDIIEMAKFESGQINISKSETNLVKLLTELFQYYKHHRTNLKKDKIEIHLSIPPEKSLQHFYTDPGRLQQVMSVLLDNALRFTEKGYIQFGYELKDAKNLMFFVKDTGPGISKDTLKNIFTRFRQIETLSNKKYPGSGLSLSIAKNIVEMLGGKISCESVPGEGSTFYFLLPLNITDKNSEKEITKESINIKNFNWKNKVILVVEDEEVNFRFIEAVLDDTQVQLIHAYNGKQGVGLCKSINKIDLILMDIKMPDMDGFDACKVIKEYKKSIPVIAQTAYTLPESRKQCKDAGFDEYIAKPIDIELLLTTLNKYLSD